MTYGQLHPHLCWGAAPVIQVLKDGHILRHRVVEIPGDEEYPHRGQSDFPDGLLKKPADLCLPTEPFILYVCQQEEQGKRTIC